MCVASCALSLLDGHSRDMQSPQRGRYDDGLVYLTLAVNLGDRLILSFE